MTSKLSTIILTFVLVLNINNAIADQSADNLDMKKPANPLENLYTGGQPSINDLHKLSKKGVKTVINLRASGEFEGFDERKVAEDLGLNYIVIEVAGSDGVNLVNTQKLHRALADLKEPVLLHCASSNRVGALLAYRAFKLQDSSVEDSLKLGKSAGMTSTEEKVKLLMQSQTSE